MSWPVRAEYCTSMSRPTTALIVDDEPHVRVFLKMMLKQLGVSVCGEASEGGRAVQLAQELKPELVLLDVNMPVKGGLATLAELQAIAPDLPVIMVSSESAMRTVHEAVRLGASAYILKHAPKEQTLRRLTEVLDALAEEPAEEEEQES